jgi:hypothetical protein
MELGAILNVATAGTVTLDVTVVLAQNSQDGSIYYYSPITVTVVDGEPEIDTGATLAPAASTTETTSAPAASTTETTSAPATATLKHCHGRRHHNDPSQRRRKNRARCSDNCSRLGRSLIGRGWMESRRLIPARPWLRRPLLPKPRRLQRPPLPKPRRPRRRPP